MTTTRTPGGLVWRTAMASAVLALVIAAAFTVLLLAIKDIRGDERRALHAQDVLIAANTVERLLLDFETGQRGFIITKQERFLEPWHEAQRRFPVQARGLLRLAADDPIAAERAPGIVRDIRAYIDDYSVPLIDAARRGDASASSDAATDEGKARVDAIRAEFDSFLVAEQRESGVRGRASEAAALRAYVGAALGTVASIALVVLYAAYLMRLIVRPVRDAAAMAGRLAGDDLSARLPETGAAEIGTLERAFNVMAESLERGRDRITTLAEEQAALRRVATLVARGEQPRAVFAAVAEEIGRLLSADHALVSRYVPTNGMTRVGAWSAVGDPGRLGNQVALGGRNVATMVFETQRPARLNTYADATGESGRIAQEMGLGSAVGAPIVVQDRLWGMIMAAFNDSQELDPGVEQRLVNFTELVATAIANAEAQAELTASRARIVATADETRRRIERDLHDGAQQRLVALALQLRAAQQTVPADLNGLEAELDEVRAGLTGAIDELREFARGIHPAILAEGGLGPALRTLARGAPVPVDLHLRPQGRLPRSVEVAVYYVVSEAVANAAKHARATVVVVDIEADDVLRMRVSDDGVGGASYSGGSGLVGLRDRVEALGGRMRLHSQPDLGTSLSIELPLDDQVAD